jgi:hypothetical protein
MSERKDTAGGANAPSNTAARLVDNLNQALENLRRSTRIVEKASRRSIKLLEQGGDVTAALNTAFPSETRAVMNSALKEVEQARHELRLFVFAACLDQGVSIAELSRQYGFSRQLAARYARDARAAQAKRQES